MRRTSLALLVAVFSAAALSAQTYRCEWSVVASGGGQMSSSGFRSGATASQTAAGLTERPDLRAFIGFWLPEIPAGPGPAGGWDEMTPMPAGLKQVGDGGWLAANAGNGLVYAARGNKQPDFFSYNPVDSGWTARAPIPPGRETKSPSKGASGCADGAGTLYATKGNNTQGFYRYSSARDSWYQLADVPLGTTNKRVKGGTDLVYVPGMGGPDYVYLLKGYRNEFWRYDPVRDSWQSLAAAPADKWDRGSWLAHDGTGRIYAHQAKYHGFFAYDINTQSWGTAMAGMPLVGFSGRPKKTKDGGSAAYMGGVIFALKGGNTQEFWRFATPAGPWAELETVPQVGSTLKRKKVKNGGCITATAGALYAMKGNRTNELWRYTPGTEGVIQLAGTKEGVLVGASAIAEGRFAIAPNPLRSGFATVHLNPRLLGSSNPVLSVYDAAGRCVMHSRFGTRTSSFPLDLRLLPSGVYMVTLTAGSSTAMSKLVVQR